MAIQLWRSEGLRFKSEKEMVLDRELGSEEVPEDISFCVFFIGAIASYLRPAVKMPILFEISVEQTRGL